MQFGHINNPFFSLKEMSVKCLRETEQERVSYYKRMQHCPQPVLLFLQLTHIQEMVLRGLPMSLAQVKLDRMFARKSPVAELALVHDPIVIVIVRGG